MKKIILVLLVMVIVAPVHAWQSKLVKKANDFIEAGMESEAIQSLEYGILEKPKDHEAHWMLGKMYLERGSYSSAEKRFNSAVLIKSSYRSKLGSLYKNVADKELSKGHTDRAISLYKKAGNADTGVRKSIGQSCFNAAKQYLSPGRSSYADKLFSVAKSYNPSLREEIQKVQVGYGQRMLKAADGKSKSEYNKYIKEAKKYLSQSTIDKAYPPPSWKTVYKKTFTGIGNTGGDDPDNDGSLYTAEHGTDMLVGDRYSVIDTDCEVWHGAGWKKCKKGEWLPVNTIQPGENATFRNRKGQQFTVVVQRFVDKVFTNPWKTVYKKTFTGIGNTGGDDPDNDGCLYTAKMGKDLLVGDRYTVIDTNFEIWRNARWNKAPKNKWFTAKKIQPGEDLSFRNKKGQKFTVVVQRYSKPKSQMK